MKSSVFFKMIEDIGDRARQDRFNAGHFITAHHQLSQRPDNRQTGTYIRLIIKVDPIFPRRIFKAAVLSIG
ncbi:hypothetical protein D9M68_911240 [compost metagenome]